MKTLRVVIADGRRILREGVSAALERHPDIRVVGDAPDLAAAARLVNALAPDVLLINWRATTDADFAEIQPSLPDLRTLGVVASFMSPSLAMLRAALATGVRGCLSKESSLGDLVDCVRTVTAGETFIGPALRTLLVEHFVQPVAAAGPALTAREREVLQRIASGRSTK